MGRVALKWMKSQLMVATDSLGHPLVVGSWPEQSPEWAGIRPSDLFLLSAAACSAYDVVMILTKQREPFDELDVTCEGTQLPEPPHTFTALHLHYAVRGPVDARKLARAIALSEEQYCSVVTTLRPVVVITSDYEVVSA